MICSSVNRLRFIAGLPAGILAESTLIRCGAVFGEQVVQPHGIRAKDWLDDTFEGSPSSRRTPLHGVQGSPRRAVKRAA